MNGLVKSYPLEPSEFMTVTEASDFESATESSLYRFFIIFTPFPLITLPLGATFRK